VNDSTQQTLDLRTPLAEVPGIPPALARQLASLGLTNVGRLIAHLPFRHEYVQPESPIGQLTPGMNAAARGQITATRANTWGPRPRFEAVLMDESGRLDLVWFNAPYLRNRIHPGATLWVQGQIRRYKAGIRMANPRFEILRDADDHVPARGYWRPIYPAGESVKSAHIERAVKLVLPATEQIEDHLPDDFRKERALPSLADAYRLQHQPDSEDDIAAARRRLAYDELLLLQLGVHMKRAQLRGILRAPALEWNERIDQHIRQRLPFTLTPGQEQVVRDLVRDLTADTPTNRLIQGDVGSGKTVVALYAMLLAVAAEHQAALMAPTEILAEQHHESMTRMLQGSRVRIELLTGARTGPEREAILGRLEAGEIDIVIGTHALLTEHVRFKSLAVAIVDEQHRFGVHQRATMRAKTSDHRSVPHVLVMTATPIPRSLAMTLFGDLDVSVIDGLPPGRQPVRTRVVAPDKRPDVYAWVRERIDDGEQAYIVAPAIDPGDGDLQDVRTLTLELESGPLEGVRIAAMHSRLKHDTREHVMARFRSGLIKALVSTTVIEVGVDVPNASVMVIENADRFGLAQLHQLRGRVGRGDRPAACVLIGNPTTPEAAQRLDAIAETTDGFQLAEKDLELRGMGEFFGTRQAGMPPFKVADLSRDLDLLRMARRDAAEWIRKSPALDKPEEATLRRRLEKTHGQWLGIGDVG